MSTTPRPVLVVLAGYLGENYERAEAALHEIERILWDEYKDKGHEATERSIGNRPRACS